jgi:hypothetical protein
MLLMNRIPGQNVIGSCGFTLDILKEYPGSSAYFVVGKVKVKFTLEQAMKAQRGSRGIALLFL